MTSKEYSKLNRTQFVETIATEHGVPPYVVFTDASLRAMARQLPRDHDAFAAIPGVGARKLEQYGDDFTALIREYADRG